MDEDTIVISIILAFFSFMAGTIGYNFMNWFAVIGGGLGFIFSLILIAYGMSQ